MMTGLAQFYASVVLFSMYSLLETQTPLHFFTLKNQKQLLFYDRDNANLTNVSGGTTVCRFEQFEWFLKGPYS